MSRDEPSAQDNTPEGPDVIILECPKCRRAQAQARANARKGNRDRDGLPNLNLQAVPDRCPHYRDVWTPGMGPGSDPLPPPGTPEERRQGPV
ncbi:hypothetical protein ThrDRAFT_01922 [Frankia casuarinae]|jgi:hypothetical protein|uniref:hypothetical protein n=1 Tax=Frankia TaxID=1854 RepID=UPI0003D06A60|nr:MULTISPECIES: hypothetical protein [Frankia]ETA01802.1 hypothetical protein CcI6DRAFT_02813 [Frankia sp. CcI6]EYT92473.1 hypothetical protein ThrDRAFT_01922 [Frankia casuarinae]KDA41290.1 hypothetical protein BMG523Draft_03878 [Frankia sp. BMG5.23]KFB04063.1 hypothetical protein ALLO2DRAFT_03117 [Frankia sp. Allo2]OAA23852.1 hypothetical protein AAY23_105018 [Frankia casuarinae]